MEIRSLFLGLVFTVGIFGVKTGAGLAYGGARLSGWRRLMLFWLSAGAMYGVLFWAAALLSRATDVMTVYRVVGGVLRFGTALHFLMAALLAVWGAALLRQQTLSRPSAGWLALALPCPVCLTVILLTTGFAVSLFPENASYMALAAFAVFFSAAAASAALVRLAGTATRLSPETLLGAAMFAMAAYFILSALLMPSFTDTERIVRLTGRPENKSGASLASLVMTGAGAVTAFGYGIVRTVTRGKGNP
jgi:predicted transporter